MHLTHRGFAVRLVTASGEDQSRAWHVRGADLNAGPLLEALAVVQPVSQPLLDTSWLAEGSHGGLTVAVLGRVDAADLPTLRRMQHRAGAALAIALDVDAWTGAPSSPDAIHALAQQGWRSVSLGPRDRLDAVWQELGHSSSQASRSVAHLHQEVAT